MNLKPNITVLFSIFKKGIRIPHTAMTMYLCSSLKERESATIYRMGFEMIGLLIALAIQGPFLSGINCYSPPNATNATSNATMSMLRDTLEATAATESFWERNIYVLLALGLTVIFLGGNYLLIFNVNEKEGNTI
jgi:Na+/melibiose symporter-like transporter